MTTEVIYCTPEWLEESARIYHETPRFEKALQKVTTRVFYRIKAAPSWGIESDILFGASVTKGALGYMAFFAEEEAKQTAEFIMDATPQEWKKILRKENKFLTDFMLGKIGLEQGSKVGVLGLAPYADVFIDALTQVKLRFQDELSDGELQDFRQYFQEFRARLNV